MSQVLFKTTYEGRQAEVMAGWDNPVGNYFLTVFDLDADDEVIWSAMDHPDREDFEGTDRLEAQLQSMGIEAPAGFWHRVHQQERNVIHVFSNGEWETK